MLTVSGTKRPSCTSRKADTPARSRSATCSASSGVVAGIITTVVLLMAGEDAALFWETILSVPESRNVVNILNSGSVLYLSGLAAAIGFRMNLFNIGVEGQYRLATILAAAVGAAVTLPAPLHVLLIVAVAVAVGALWAGIVGVLEGDSRQAHDGDGVVRVRLGHLPVQDLGPVDAAERQGALGL